jgi:hypothetical protein
MTVRVLLAEDDALIPAGLAVFLGTAEDLEGWRKLRGGPLGHGKKRTHLFSEPSRRRTFRDGSDGSLLRVNLRSAYASASRLGRSGDS